MLTECPRCQVQIRVEGGLRAARLVCPGCGGAFRLSAPRASRSGLALGLAAAALAGVALTLIVRSSRAQAEEPLRAPEPEAPALAAAPQEDAGWAGAAVQAAVRVHEAAAARDADALRALLAPAAAEGALALLLAGEDAYAPARWRPFDGALVERDEGRALVRLACAPRAAQELPPEERMAKRWLEWELARDARGGWRARAWRRWVSPEEERAAAPRNALVVLSDGSRVVERPGERLGHLEETPPELRARIDALLVTMNDLDLTVEGDRAQAALVAIGRAAIPPLLSALHESPLESTDDAIRCNRIDQCLRAITGETFGFRPQIFEGSSLGTTAERRDSAIRQWFAWWNMHQDDFGLEPDPQGAARPAGARG